MRTQKDRLCHKLGRGRKIGTKKHSKSYGPSYQVELEDLSAHPEADITEVEKHLKKNRGYRNWEMAENRLMIFKSEEWKPCKDE